MKRKTEEEAAERRRLREAERLADLEKARKQQQREEEAERNRIQRAAEKAAEREKGAAMPRKPFGTTVAASATLNGGETWRKTGPLPPVAPPSRPESPAPSAKVSAVASSGGWRAREEARRQATAGGAAPPPAAAASPAQTAPYVPAKKEDAAKDEDGFQTVSEKKGVWRPRRGRV